MCIYQHSKTKTTGHVITKLGSWIVLDKSWSPILFEVICQGWRESALF